MNYIVVGAHPFKMSNGSITFTRLLSLGSFEKLEEANKCRTDHYDQCAGLIEVFEIGKENATIPWWTLLAEKYKEKKDVAQEANVCSQGCA